MHLSSRTNLTPHLASLIDELGSQWGLEGDVLVIGREPATSGRPALPSASLVRPTRYRLELGDDNASLIGAMIADGLAETIESLWIGANSATPIHHENGYTASLDVFFSVDWPALHDLSIGNFHLLCNAHETFATLGRIDELPKRVPNLRTLELWGGFALTTPTVFARLESLVARIGYPNASCYGPPLDPATCAALFDSTYPVLRELSLAPLEPWKERTLGLTEAFLAGVRAPRLESLSLDAPMTACELRTLFRAPLTRRTGFHLHCSAREEGDLDSMGIGTAHVPRIEPSAADARRLKEVLIRPSLPDVRFLNACHIEGHFRRELGIGGVVQGSDVTLAWCASLSAKERLSLKAPLVLDRARSYRGGDATGFIDALIESGAAERIESLFVGFSPVEKRGRQHRLEDCVARIARGRWPRLRTLSLGFETNEYGVHDGETCRLGDISALSGTMPVLDRLKLSGHPSPSRVLELPRLEHLWIRHGDGWFGRDSAPIDQTTLDRLLDLSSVPLQTLTLDIPRNDPDAGLPASELRLPDSFFGKVVLSRLTEVSFGSAIAAEDIERLLFERERLGACFHLGYRFA